MSLLARSLGRAARGARRGARLLFARDGVVVFSATASDVRAQQPTLAPGTDWSLRVTIVREIDSRVAASLPPSLRACVPNNGPDDELHCIYVGERLAAWGFAAYPASTWNLTETGTVLRLPPASACLTAFETAAEFRGRRLYPTLLASMTTSLVARGAKRAYIWCVPGNRASRSAIERVGFRFVGEHRRVRVLGVSRTWIADDSTERAGATP